MHRNGFQRPFEVMQIYSWVLTVVLIMCSLFILAPLLDTPFQYIFFVLSVLSSVTVITLCIVTTITDPKDPSIEKDNRELPCYCYLCNAHIPKTTKHCRKCQKCIENFDHHCLWLNNCIGKSNYSLFISLLVACSIMLLINCLASIYLVIIFIINPSLADSTLFANYISISLPYYVYMIILAVILIINIIPLGYILQLLFFHIRLIYLHETTYSFLIKKERKNKLKKTQMKLEKYNKESQQYNMHAHSEVVRDPKLNVELEEVQVRRSSSASSFFATDKISPLS
ncbi:hypothetical protein WA158_007035 [Blastocystis sp. Blastoise]